MMRNLLILLMLSVPGTAVCSSLCATNEETYFSCAVGASHKYVSLCGSKSLLAPSSYLQYRFGTKDSIELEFPSSKKDSLRKFSYYHNFRFQLDRTNVSFANNGFSYFIFSTYDGEAGTPTQESGVVVINGVPPGLEMSLVCKGHAVEQLSRLEGAVPCDTSDPLSSCRVGL